MNWFSNGFLGVYAELLEKQPPAKPESKTETLRQLRLRRYEEAEARASARAGGVVDAHLRNMAVKQDRE